MGLVFEAGVREIGEPGARARFWAIFRGMSKIQPLGLELKDKAFGDWKSVANALNGSTFRN